MAFPATCVGTIIGMGALMSSRGFGLGSMRGVVLVANTSVATFVLEDPSRTEDLEGVAFWEGSEGVASWEGSEGMAFWDVVGEVVKDVSAGCVAMDGGGGGALLVFGVVCFMGVATLGDVASRGVPLLEDTLAFLPVSDDVASRSVPLLEDTLAFILCFSVSDDVSGATANGEDVATLDDVVAMVMKK